jgi:TRAP-type C4-dicarboxylate transport system permease large subunit
MRRVGFDDLSRPFFLPAPPLTSAIDLATLDAASSRFRKPVPEVLRAVLPIIIMLTLAVLLITYVPWLTTALPRWLGKEWQ